MTVTDHHLALRVGAWALLCPVECDPFECVLVSTAAAAFMAGPPPALLGVFRCGVDPDGTFYVGARLAVGA